MTETSQDLSNKLYCTFTEKDNIEGFIEHVKRTYTLLHGKIFILETENENEYLCTYNIEQPEVRYIPDNTILVHRKKESNTLYTINALNKLIQKLNNGYLDRKYRVEWHNYKNSVMLVRQGEFKLLNTKLHKIEKV